VQASDTLRRLGPPLSLQDLVDGLIAAGDSFECNELSYLALTSVAEHVVRDRLAWALYKRGFRVGREWRYKPHHQIDLVVFDDGGEPLCALELKAAYTHDVLWKRATSTLETQIRDDAERALEAAGAGAAYTLLIAMHRHNPVPSVPPVLHKLIKQSDKNPRDWGTAEQQLLQYLRPLGDVSKRILLGDGSVFGISIMTVTAWLCGPLKRREEWNALSEHTHAVLGGS
jgi:hypothetical protein